MTKADLTTLFTFHPLEGPQLERVGAIRAAGLEFAEEILRQVPDSTMRESAIQHVLEAVMLSNCGIANAEAPGHTPSGDDLTPVPAGDA